MVTMVTAMSVVDPKRLVPAARYRDPESRISWNPGSHICNQSLIMSCRLVSNSDFVPLTLFCPTSST